MCSAGRLNSPESLSTSRWRSWFSLPPSFFVSAVPGLILGAAFTVFAYTSIKFGFLKSLHSVSRGAYGTVYYPVAFLTLIALFWNSHPQIVSLSMLCLGIGDASAAIVGESITRPMLFHLTSDRKSIQGSLTMFSSSCLALFAGLSYFGGMNVSGGTMASAAICASLIATAFEALSSHALDNLTIPLSVGFVLYYTFVPTRMQDVFQFDVGVALGIVIAVAAYYARFLKASGSVATFLLASLIYGLGGWKWTVPILTFFVLSSILSKWGRSRKRSIELISEKTGTRDAGQVAANGGIAGILMLAQYLFQSLDFYPLYLAAVAAVTADTWGTEVGTYVRGRTVSIISMKDVSPGMSGGVSLGGLIGGLVGAALVAMSATPWIDSAQMMLLPIAAGIVASLVDSLLGATVQAQYRCAICGEWTERKTHCFTGAELVQGMRWIDNDVVNWACALSGVIAALVMGG